jgi:AcrR family transcriptional regulator
MGRVRAGDPRVKRTKALIRHAFIEWLAIKDFEDITVQDIVDRAELNRATFYNHYRDKYELLDATMADMFAEMLSDWIPPEASMQGAELVRRLMLAVCEWQVETTQRLNARRSLTHAIEESAKRQLYGVILSCLDQAKPPNADRRRLERIATMISWSICGVVVQWSVRREETAEALVEEAMPYLMSLVDRLHMPDGNPASH